MLSWNWNMNIFLRINFGDRVLYPNESFVVLINSGVFDWHLMSGWSWNIIKIYKWIKMASVSEMKIMCVLFVGWNKIPISIPRKPMKPVVTVGSRKRSNEDFTVESRSFKNEFGRTVLGSPSWQSIFVHSKLFFYVSVWCPFAFKLLIGVKVLC